MVEEMQQVNSAIPEPMEPPSTPPVLTTPKKSPWPIILSLLLVVALATTGYFYWQTTLLRSVTPSALSPSPTPVASVDPTADWKTYTNTSANYVVKYPQDWKIENQAAGSSSNDVPSSSRFIEIFQPQPDPTQSLGNIGFEEMGIIPPSEEKMLTITKEINGLTLKCQGTEDVNSKLWCWVKVPGQDKYLNIHIFTNSSVPVNKTYYQILSTLTFNNQ